MAWPNVWAQVQQGADAAFTLVLRHDVGFHGTAAAYGLGQYGFVLGAQRAHILLQPVDKTGITQQAVFDHFRQTGR